MSTPSPKNKEVQINKNSTKPWSLLPFYKWKTPINRHLIAVKVINIIHNFPLSAFSPSILLNFSGRYSDSPPTPVLTVITDWWKFGNLVEGIHNINLTKSFQTFFSFVFLKLAYCVVQFLEKDATLTENVSFLLFCWDFVSYTHM